MVSNVSKLEYLCDAIAEYIGSHNPKSSAYKCRNPLALREVRKVDGKLAFGELRKYRSWVHGYESALFDLRLKCSGRSSSGITQFSSIANLTGYYGMPEEGAKNVADYLSYALEDERITPETKLFVFLK